MGNKLKNLLDNIKRIKSANRFKDYIDFIQFPYYRNLEINTKISFDFPLTIFIGANGCGKSSTLHALYGAPLGKTPYEFWFDTKVDPVKYFDDEKRRHSFWYSYKDKHNIDREVVKARIKRKGDPNYWETSRPLVWAGMQTINGKRNAPLKKNVVYIDFRAILSAFDKFYYFGTLKNSKSKNKQEFIRRKSNSLNKLFQSKIEYIKSKTRRLNDSLSYLSDEELKNISFILGRNYTSGKSINHSLFRNEGYSVLFNTNFANYSEACAGSGEMAIVKLVQTVLEAQQYSLIILDEPEVSLHPGAQHRLKLFLLEQIKIKKHQLIVSSHSPTLIKGLPKEAIKVFYQMPNGRFHVVPKSLPEEAFFHIGYSISDKKIVIVEDELAKIILEKVIESKGGEAFKTLFDVKFFPGGESRIKQDLMTVYSKEVDATNHFVCFDGNQRKDSINIIKLSDINKTSEKLAEIIFEIVEQKIIFNYNSNESEETKIKLMLDYIKYHHDKVFFLPKNMPEEIIWCENVLDAADLDNSSKKEILSQPELKDKFNLFAKYMFGNNTAEYQLKAHEYFLVRWLKNKNEDYESIIKTIDKIIACNTDNT